MAEVRIGVVGGAFGGAFPWHEHPDCKVEAVADLDPEALDRMSAAYSCGKRYGSLQELLRDRDVDAVAIFTPAPDHARHSIAALRAGKHVVSAVPAAITLEDCYALRETIEETGLTYMMAETSYWYQAAISARQFQREGRFGTIYYTEAEYLHAGLEKLYIDSNGNRTWRYGFPPMLYPTHCTAFLVGTTGERLTEVSCLGWGDDSSILKDNPYSNPFWNETAFFKTDRGNAMRVAIYWKGAHRGRERADWYGDKMSFFMSHPNWDGAVIVRSDTQIETDSAGFARELPLFEPYEQPKWWATDMLPEPLRHDSGHDGSHPFIVHEFISSIVESKRPAVDIYEALAYTAPGIVAHESALKGGERLAIPTFDR